MRLALLWCAASAPRLRARAVSWQRAHRSSCRWSHYLIEPVACTARWERAVETRSVCAGISAALRCTDCAQRAADAAWLAGVARAAERPLGVSKPQSVAGPLASQFEAARREVPRRRWCRDAPLQRRLPLRWQDGVAAHLRRADRGLLRARSSASTCAVSSVIARSSIPGIRAALEKKPRLRTARRSRTGRCPSCGRCGIASAPSGGDRHS